MKNLKKLIIAPHIDDEVLGCGGILDKDTLVVHCGVERAFGRAIGMDEECAARKNPFGEVCGHLLEGEIDRGLLKPRAAFPARADRGAERWWGLGVCHPVWMLRRFVLP